MTRDAIETALGNLPGTPLAETSSTSPTTTAPVVETAEAEPVLVTAGTAVVLYKIHVAQRCAEQPSRPLWKLAVAATSALQWLRLLAVLAALMIAMVAGGLVASSGDGTVWMGIAAMIGVALALGGGSLFALQLTELVVFRGLARRA